MTIIVLTKVLNLPISTFSKLMVDSVIINFNAKLYVLKVVNVSIAQVMTQPLSV